MRSKSELVADKVLVPYNEKRKLILACDASPYGVGAVISHVMDDGEERPIASASRTLTKSELLANREGSPGNCIWCPEVSQVSIRSNVSPVNRSQAISDHLGS